MQPVNQEQIQLQEVDEKNADEKLAEQKKECARLLKIVIDHYWKPDFKPDKAAYVADESVVNRNQIYTREFPCSGVNFTEQWPGIYLGLVPASNPLVNILRELFNNSGLSILRNPHQMKQGHVFCAFQVVNEVGLNLLLGNLREQPELKSILEAEAAAQSPEEVEAAIPNPTTTEDISLVAANGVDIYMAVANMCDEYDFDEEDEIEHESEKIPPQKNSSSTEDRNQSAKSD